MAPIIWKMMDPCDRCSSKEWQTQNYANESNQFEI